MSHIPQWVVITAGAVAVLALVYGKHLGMDLSPTTLATIGVVVGAVVNFLGKTEPKSEEPKHREEEETDALD